MHTTVAGSTNAYSLRLGDLTNNRFLSCRLLWKMWHYLVSVHCFRYPSWRSSLDAKEKHIACTQFDDFNHIIDPNILQYIIPQISFAWITTRMLFDVVPTPLLTKARSDCQASFIPTASASSRKLSLQSKSAQIYSRAWLEWSSA